jgi:hypothetical protein
MCSRNHVVNGNATALTHSPIISIYEIYEEVDKHLDLRLTSFKICYVAEWYSYYRKYGIIILKQIVRNTTSGSELDSTVTG